MRDLPDQAIKRIDRDRTTVRIPAKDEDMPTLIRNSWVVVHRVEIPRERKDKITLFFEPSSTKRLVFETADLDLAVQQMKKSTEEERNFYILSARRRCRGKTTVGATTD